MRTEPSKRSDAEASLRHAPVGRPLARLALAAAAVAGVLGVIDAGLFYWSHVVRGAEPTVTAPRIAPPAPAAPSPAAPRYRWVDRAAGIAEIPIERALRLLATDGDAAAPQPHEPAAAARRSAAPRSGSAAAAAEPESAEPTAAASRPPIPGIGFAPQLGSRVDVAATVNDDDGRRVELGELLGGVSLVVPVYYRCPNLCDLTLDGVAELAATAAASGAAPADVLLVSFAENEGLSDARAMRTELTARHPEIARGERWHFLTASRDDIARITRSIGFRFERSVGAPTYAHAAGAVVVAPDGRLLAFLPGVRFAAERLAALVTGRAAAAQAAWTPPSALLWCFSYDVHTGRYTLVVWRALQAGVVLCVAALALGIVAMNRRSGLRGGSN
jgi:protein SCO1/2